MARGIYRTISEQIAYRIRIEILSGSLPRNTLLKEQQLSDRFEVSRGTIRAALQLLMREGIVEMTPNVGTKVAGSPEQEVVDLIIHIRLEIEEFVLRKVWQNLKENYLPAWKEILSGMESAANNDNLDEYIETDISFHRFFIVLHPEDHVLNLWEMVRNRTIPSYSSLRDLNHRVTEHQNILKAVEVGDIEAAIRSLRANVV